MLLLLILSFCRSILSIGLQVLAKDVFQLLKCMHMHEWASSVSGGWRTPGKQRKLRIFSNIRDRGRLTGKAEETTRRRSESARVLKVLRRTRDGERRGQRRGKAECRRRTEEATESAMRGEGRKTKHDRMRRAQRARNQTRHDRY